MHAAVVNTYGQPPAYQEFAEPAAKSDEIVVDVVAAGLHPRVRSGAAGTHYTSTGALPMIPGVDAVGRRSDGRLIYFAAADDLIGTMAERAVVDPHRAIELPDDVDVLKVAATMNPAMSSWVALRRRISFQPGMSVLVLGATGNAGTMAVQVAKHLGAGKVVGAGRNPERLDALRRSGADTVVPLTGDRDETAAALADAAANVDVVIDYLWGDPTQDAITALLTAREDRSKALDWVQIGAVAGPTIQLPSVALRSANLRLLGNGQGAVSPRGYLAELPALVDVITGGGLAIEPIAKPLADVEHIWDDKDASGQRSVLVP